MNKPNLGSDKKEGLNAVNKSGMKELAVDATEIEENQLFQTLADLKEMLKDTYLSNDAHKMRTKTKQKMAWCIKLK